MPVGQDIHPASPGAARRVPPWLLFALILLLAIAAPPATARAERPAPGPTRLIISGFVLDAHRAPVREAQLQLAIDGHPQPLYSHGEESRSLETGPDGEFLAEVDLPGPLGPGKLVTLAVRKPGFRPATIHLAPAEFAIHTGEYLAEREVVLTRHTGIGFWLAAAVLLGVYLLITLELIHRTVVAMLGASFLLAVSAIGGRFLPELKIISFAGAVSKIDFNVIFLLFGMMVIVGVLKESGLFQWAAARCYSLARGRILVLAIMLMVLTAIASAFLDNVTTMLLIAPVTIEIAVALQISPLAFLLPEIMAANVGGAATLIGDPPNIMIGSYAGLTFLDFLSSLGLVCALALIPLVLLSRRFFAADYQAAAVEDRGQFARELRAEHRITDRGLLVVGLCILSLVIGLFASHGYWHMEVSVAALIGAALLFSYALLTDRVQLQEFIEREIDWGTLLFFIFLFMIIGAVEEAGLLATIADGILHLSRAHLGLAIALILWGSALASAFVDNIPFTATMLPVTAYLSQVIPGAEGHVLWWALALGACFGGNGTLIGASANVVTVGIAETRGYHIGFLRFFRFGFLYMLISVALCHLWLILVF
jgi:Na+/H+ antiporter NhaD/arsenite permease-like protein